jgi:hypothetical protein
MDGHTFHKMLLQRYPNTPEAVIMAHWQTCQKVLTVIFDAGGTLGDKVSIDGLIIAYLDKVIDENP